MISKKKLIASIILLSLLFSSAACAWSWKGALKGTGVAGLGWGLACSMEGSSGNSDGSNFGSGFGRGALLGAPIGFVIGGLVGKDDKPKEPEKETTAWIPPQKHLAVNPQPNFKFLTFPPSERYELKTTIF